MVSHEPAPNQNRNSPGNDGSRWESDHKAGGPKLAGQREILRFVAQRGGLAIRHVNFIEDIPPQ